MALPRSASRSMALARPACDVPGKKLHLLGEGSLDLAFRAALLTARSVSGTSLMAAALPFFSPSPKAGWPSPRTAATNSAACRPGGSGMRPASAGSRLGSWTSGFPACGWRTMLRFLICRRGSLRLWCRSGLFFTNPAPKGRQDRAWGVSPRSGAGFRGGTRDGRGDGGAETYHPAREFCDSARECGHSSRQLRHPSERALTAPRDQPSR